MPGSWKLNFPAKSALRQVRQLRQAPFQKEEKMAQQSMASAFRRRRKSVGERSEPERERVAKVFELMRTNTRRRFPRAQDCAVAEKPAVPQFTIVAMSGARGAMGAFSSCRE